MQISCNAKPKIKRRALDGVFGSLGGFRPEGLTKSETQCLPNGEKREEYKDEQTHACSQRCKRLRGATFTRARGTDALTTQT